MTAADFTRPGAWRELLAQALTLTDHLERVVRDPVWSFWGRHCSHAAAEPPAQQGH